MTLGRAGSFVLGFVWLAATAGAAAAAPPLRQSFDVQAPAPPTPVSIGGRLHLVYELHLTSFSRDVLEIARLLIADRGRGTVLADLGGTELEAALGRPGLAAGGAGSRRAIAPGLRAVVYLWVALPSGAPAPDALAHRFELEAVRDGGSREPITLELQPVAVGTSAPPVLGPPLRGGPWVAIYGPEMERGHRRVLFAVDGQVHLPGRFAIDWMKLGADGKLSHGDPSRVESWEGYGAPVLAVADAVVAVVRDDVAESPTLTDHRSPLEDASGNAVVLDLGAGRYAFYEHLQPGSVGVHAGERVRRGQVLARLGYTGDSTGPHLHFHVADAPSALAAEGMPWVLEGYERLGGYASMAAFGQGDAWTPEAPERRARRVELPEANAVVRFPDK